MENAEKTEAKKKASKKVTKKTLNNDGEFTLVGVAPWGNMNQPVDGPNEAAEKALEWRQRYEPTHRVALRLEMKNKDGEVSNRTGQLMDLMEEIRLAQGEKEAKKQKEK